MSTDSKTGVIKSRDDDEDSEIAILDPKLDTSFDDKPTTSHEPLARDSFDQPSVYSSSCSKHIKSEKFSGVEKDVLIEVQIEHYKWCVKWSFHSFAVCEPSTSSATPQRGIQVTVTKLSNYSYEWEFQLILEIQIAHRQIVKKDFEFVDDHLMKEFFVDLTDIDESKIGRLNVQIVATNINYVWINHGTEIAFEDSSRPHDFVLIADQDEDVEVIELDTSKTKFYVHLNYLKAWSNYFRRLDEPKSPFKLRANPWTLHDLLRLMHPNMKQTVSSDTVKQVMKLACALEIPNVINYLAEELCSPKNFLECTLFKRLYLGDIYKHRKLIIETLKQIHELPRYDHSEIRRQRNYIEHLSQEVMAELLIAMAADRTQVFDQSILNNINSCEVYKSIDTTCLDTTLVMGEDEILVSATVLATWSQYFDQLFVNAPKPEGARRYTVDHVDPAMFRIILQLVETKNPYFLKRDTVEKVIQLAHYLQMPSIVSICSFFLVEYVFSNINQIIYVLVIGEQVNSGHLIHTALTKLETIADKQQFAKDNQVYLQCFSQNTLKNMFVAIAAKPEPVEPVYPLPFSLDFLNLIQGMPM